MRWVIMSFTAFVVLVADQITKYLVVASMPVNSAHPLASFFSLVHVRNRGAAFGILNDPDIVWQKYFFLGVTAAALGFMFVLAKTTRPSEKVVFWALGLISGGAIGNAIDRLLYGEVVDFLDFYLGDLHWPAFNIADIAICVGAGLMVLSILFQPKDAQ